MMPVCPICGKRFVVHWPEHWVYRRGPTYYCSDQCMDVSITRDTKTLNDVLSKKRKKFIMKQGKIKDAMRQKAVEMAIRGESPLPYLKECGAKNPSACWQYIRHTLEKKDPETYAKLPDKLPRTAAEAMEGMKEAADKFFAACDDMVIKTPYQKQAETPERPTTITINANDVSSSFIETPEGDYVQCWKEPQLKYKIRSVETELGTYTADDEYFEFTSAKHKGDTIELEMADFIKLAAELPMVMEVLGVEL